MSRMHTESPRDWPRGFRRFRERLLSGEGRLRFSTLEAMHQYWHSKGEASDDRCGDKIIAVKRQRCYEAFAQASQRARIHVASGPDGVVGDKEERCGAEDNSSSGAHKCRLSVEQ